MNNGAQFPVTVYATPNSWGSVTIYADERGMEATIESLKEAGGAEWNSIDIDDCTEYELVSPCNDGSVAFRPRHVRHDANREVLILRPDSDDPRWFERVEIFDARYDVDELAALGVVL